MHNQFYNLKIFLLLLSFFLSLTSALCFASVTDSYPFESVQEEKHFKDFISEIRCVVCQNESIADSKAPLANALRQKIYMMMRDHQSDVAIENYLVKRYGESILLNPRFNWLTLILWIFPLLGLIIGTWFVIKAKG